MTQHIMSHRTHILRNHVATTLDEGESTGSLCQIDAGTRRTAKGDHVFQILHTIAIRIARSKDDVGNILLNLLINIDITHDRTRLQNLFRSCNRGNGRHLSGNILADDLLLFLKRRIIDDNLQHKTVYLSFWKRIGTFLLNGILGSHYQERIRQYESLTANGDLFLLHGFQQSTLNLSRSTVNFICQHEIGKYRTLLHLEFLIFLRIDHRTDDVSR